MNIEISKTLESDIINFAKINEIEDINSFLVGCLREGFNIAKYGISPQDNFKNENKPLKIEKYEDAEENNSEGLEGEKKKRRGRPKKQITIREEETKSVKKEEEIKPKKTIRIIKK